MSNRSLEDLDPIVVENIFKFCDFQTLAVCNVLNQSFHILTERSAFWNSLYAAMHFNANDMMNVEVDDELSPKLGFAYKLQANKEIQEERQLLQADADRFDSVCGVCLKLQLMVTAGCSTLPQYLCLLVFFFLLPFKLDGFMDHVLWRHVFIPLYIFDACLFIELFTYLYLKFLNPNLFRRINEDFWIPSCFNFTFLRPRPAIPNIKLYSANVISLFSWIGFTIFCPLYLDSGREKAVYGYIALGVFEISMFFFTHMISDLYRWFHMAEGNTLSYSMYVQLLALIYAACVSAILWMLKFEGYIPHYWMAGIPIFISAAMVFCWTCVYVFIKKCLHIEGMVNQEELIFVTPILCCCTLIFIGIFEGLLFAKLDQGRFIYSALWVPIFLLALMFCPAACTLCVVSLSEGAEFRNGILPNQ